MNPVDALGVVMDRKPNYSRLSAALANELEALDAWLDAKCSGSHGDDDDDTCPVEIARKALIAANEARRKL